MCKVSVIMGAYNCADTLAEAIQSILSQTFTDWELIVCDDGSSDDTASVAERLCRAHPDKLTLLRNGTNLGLAATLNRCLSVARGEYIARMDADDRCSPERLAHELAVLESPSAPDFVSTDMLLFDENGVWGRVSYPSDPKPTDFAWGTPFCHAPCLIRTAALQAVGGYDTDRRLLRVEDYHLWLKLYCHGYRGRNLPLPLYQMRDDRNACRRRALRFRLNEAYVTALAVRRLRLPFFYFPLALRPIVKGLLPPALYRALHRIRRRK